MTVALPNRFAACLAAALAALAGLTGVSAEPAEQQGKSADPPPASLGTLQLWFGDRADQGLLRVALALSREFGEAVVPTREARVARGDGLCTVYQREGILPETGRCDVRTLERLSVQLNPGVDPSQLYPGQRVQVPDIQVSTGKGELRARLPAPSDLADVDAAAAIIYRSARDVTLTVDYHEDPNLGPPSLYSLDRTAPADYISACLNGQPPGAQGAYWHLLDWLQSWQPPECLFGSDNQGPVKTVLIDTDVKPHCDLDGQVTWLDCVRQPAGDELRCSPVIKPPAGPCPDAGGAGATSPPTCAQGDFVAEKHHGTHLASIMASRGSDDRGMVGVDPLADVESFPWVQSNRLANLQRFFNQRSSVTYRSQHPPEIFVFASKLPDPSNRTGEKQPSYFSFCIENGQLTLTGNCGRQGNAVAKSIMAAPGIPWIVAAGQYDSPQSKPEQVEAALPFSPQNLGDLPNVIVVTTCKGNCYGSDAAVWDRARYSDRFVHVAAPGHRVPGFLSDTEFASASGTSQATAFVAGVVSSMLRCHRDYFYDEDQFEVKTKLLKRRLQVTSRPLFWQQDDLERVATGVVDPEAALLDPRKHWLKKIDSLGGHWQIIEPDGWCAGQLQRVTVDGQPSPTAVSNVLRIVRNEHSPLDDSSNGGDVAWSIYSRFWNCMEAGCQDIDKVTRWDPALITQPGPSDAVMRLKDGRLLKLADIQDLVLARAIGRQVECDQ